MTYEKKQLSAVKADVDRAVAEIAQKHGLVVAKSAGVYGSRLEVKIEFARVSESGVVESADAASFRMNARLLGLKPEWLGQSFDSRGASYQIVGLRPRRKQPVLAKCSKDGKTYLFDAEVIALRMNAQEQAKGAA